MSGVRWRQSGSRPAPTDVGCYARVFRGSERAYVVPSSTHLASWRLVRTSCDSTRSHPFIDRPRIFMGRAFVVATSASDCAGSTRTRSPPWPLAATAMLPPMRKASPPNILCSVRSDSLPASSRIRSASCSSYGTTAIVRQDGPHSATVTSCERDPSALSGATPPPCANANAERRSGAARPQA